MAAAAAIRGTPAAVLCFAHSPVTAAEEKSTQQVCRIKVRCFVPQLPGKFQRCTNGSPQKHVRGRGWLPTRAMAEESTGEPSQESTSKAAEELEALERALGREKSSTKVRRRRRQPKPQAATPLKPVQAVKKELTWDEMGPVRKVQEILYGEKGFLFWLNKLAYYAIFAVIGGWILFRFVGPATGLYDLVNPLDVPR